jgi:hypothetical protein
MAQTKQRKPRAKKNGPHPALQATTGEVHTVVSDTPYATAISGVRPTDPMAPIPVALVKFHTTKAQDAPGLDLAQHCRTRTITKYNKGHDIEYVPILQQFRVTYTPGGAHTDHPRTGYIPLHQVIYWESVVDWEAHEKLRGGAGN